LLFCVIFLGDKSYREEGHMFPWLYKKDQKCHPEQVAEHGPYEDALTVGALKEGSIECS